MIDVKLMMCMCVFDVFDMCKGVEECDLMYVEVIVCVCVFG